MKPLELVRDRFSGGSSGYECVFCRQQFDRERLNCPACGWFEIRRVR
jgi:hypothetical protein